MEITDGTTTLTFTGTRFDDFTNVEKSTSTTAGGNKRSTTAGHRFIVKEGIRETGTVYGQLVALLTNGATTYYYTPTNVPDYLSSSDFPMRVNIEPPTKKRHVGGGTKKYYIELAIEGSAYL